MPEFGRTRTAASYTIGWVTALPLELKAAIAMLEEEYEAPFDFFKNHADENNYTWGRIGHHNVVIACLSEFGKVEAATTAFGMRASLPHLKFGLMVGIGAGVPRVLANGKVSFSSDIRLGDVVVGYPKGTNPGVVQYDLEKLKHDGQRE